MVKRYKYVKTGDITTNISVHTENGSLQQKRRYVQKEGNCNILFRHVPDGWLLYVTDIYTTLVEIRWRVVLLLFALSYIMSWLFFGIFYWVLALAHGDVKDQSNEPCVYEVRSFTAAFLFSLETQTTIGYGVRGMSENCMVAIIVVTIQDVLSCLIDTFVIGIVVAKMANARKRAQTVGFSSCAVVNLHGGSLCLSWRVGDFRRHHMVEGTACAQIVRSTVHASGRLDVTYTDLAIQQSEVLLVTPATIYHRIEPGSPLYKMSLEDLRREDFELVVSFTYSDSSTGTLHQTRTSYTPLDVQWGHVFQDMIRVTKKHFTVDYTMFHCTAKVFTPEHSAEDYTAHCKEMQPSSGQPPRHSPGEFSAGTSPQQSPQATATQARVHREHRLKPPLVTVELVSDLDVETLEAEETTAVLLRHRGDEQQNALCPPPDMSVVQQNWDRL